MKISSFIKSLVPSEKSLSRLSRIENLVPISPKDQGDISGLVLPRIGANNWTPNNVDLDYLQKMYDCHDLVYNCISLVSRTFALAKLRVKKYDTQTQKYNYIPDHPLQLILNNPNRSMSGFDLKQSYVVHRLLFGTSAFILIRGHKMVSENHLNSCPECLKLVNKDCPHVLWHFNKGPVTQIIPVHLDRLNKKTYKTSFSKNDYFLYNWGDGVDRLVHPDNIITDPNYNPGGSFYGSSPTAIVQRWLEIDLGLTKQVGAYLVNNAIPSMILNLKPPKSGNDQIGTRENPSTLLEAMKEKWMKDFSMNGYNSNYGNKVKTPAFVYGDLEILKVQDSLKDIVLKPLFYQIENRIAQTYKVPRSLFEFGLDYSSQGSVVEHQYKQFFNEAIAPELESFKSKIERYIVRSFDDPTLEIEWDLSAMGISSFITDKKNSHILKLWEMGIITRDSAREMLGLNPIGNELGDDLYRIDILGTNNNGERLNQPTFSADDNILKPNPKLTDDAYGE